MRFFSPPEKPTFKRAAQHLPRYSELVRGPIDAANEIRRRDLVLAALLSLRVERGLEEGHGRDARNLERILEGEEQSLRRALVGFHLEEVFAVEQDLALRDLIFVLAGDDIGEGRFARSRSAP